MAKIEIKICGITNLDDALAAIDAGADYLGFILYAGSKRGITAARTVEIIDKLQTPVGKVCVFVNSPRCEIETFAKDCGFCAVQLHGDEKHSDFMDFPVPIWRAVRWKNNSWQHGPLEWEADRYLVDAAVEGEYGGTGTKADWEEAAELARTRPVMLAGGLTPENVAAAVAAVHPLGVDVVSGVESEPGRKDHVRMRRFVAAVRNEGVRP